MGKLKLTKRMCWNWWDPLRLDWTTQFRATLRPMSRLRQPWVIHCASPSHLTPLTWTCLAYLPSSNVTCPTVQKMWASSCWNAPALVRPLRKLLMAHSCEEPQNQWSQLAFPSRSIVGQWANIRIERHRAQCFLLQRDAANHPNHYSI